MAEQKKQNLYLGAVAALVIGLAIVVILFAGGPDIPSENGAQGVEKGNGGKTEQSDDGAGAAVAAWGDYTDVTTIVIKAEEVESLQGEMKLGKALDNKNQRDERGNRLPVRYVGVKDETCGKDDDPAQHAATFRMEVEEAGTYYPWVRVWWKDSCGDSLVVVLKGPEGQERELPITDETHEKWRWLPLACEGGVELKQGTHTVIVKNREDGARLSRILFATQDCESYMPQSPEG